MSRVSLQQVVKRYPKATAPAVKAVTFDVEEGELLVILGPSGCGKTSTLRMVAGLETVTSGRITFDGALVNEVPPAKRNVAMAFENYGLYEHWTVFDNIAYPLRLRGEDGPEIGRIVRGMAAKLDIASHLHERPAGLSGGMRQRIGLARALVRQPSVFLLDEPMSHVDADLRNDMRAEIKRIHQEVGSTMIIVTHDQLDALAMADRVLVMNEGQIEQHDAPEVVYDRPATAFVAGFIGEPPMNMVSAEVSSEGTRLRLAEGTEVSVPSRHLESSRHIQPGTQLALAFRPHLTALSTTPPTQTGEGGLNNDLVIPATVYMVEPLGDRTVVSVRAAGELLKADLDQGDPPRVDERVWIVVRGDDLHLFDGETGQRVADGQRAHLPAS